MIQIETVYFDTIVSSAEFIKDEIPVLLGIELKEETNFPFSENLDLKLHPDWIFYFAVGVIAIFAWIKLVYARLTLDIIASTVNYQISLRLFKNANIVQKRISLLYSVFYFLNFSVYLFLIFEYFKYSPADLQYLSLIFSILGFLMAMFLMRTLIFLITGLVFKREKLFQEAAFHNSLFNKLTGIIVLPFILIISYISDIYVSVAIYSSLFLVVSINILRLIRSINFIIKNVISYFYLILYLCALEILPLMVIIRVLHSL